MKTESPKQLTSLTRLLLVGSAFCLMVIASAAACLPLAISADMRTAVAASSFSLTLLCVAILIQDFLDPAIRRVWNTVLHQVHRLAPGSTV